jgi:hypothetical protein
VIKKAVISVLYFFVNVGYNMIIKQNEKWKFGLKWINGRIFTQTDFVGKMEKWNGKKGKPHFLIQESDKSMGLRITTRKDS